MPQLTITRHLQRFFPTLALESDVVGETVRAAIDSLERLYPGFGSYIVDDTGKLRRHVNIFVNEEPIHDRAGLSDKLTPTDRLFILQALSGG